jgi:hypothetical protein
VRHISQKLEKFFLESKFSGQLDDVKSRFFYPKEEGHVRLHRGSIEIGSNLSKTGILG